jgi:LysM repeat protein
MNKSICPYLGLKEDPTTALDFPSEGNYCHHARPISPVKGIYQQQYCLTAKHSACPVFRAAHPRALPAVMGLPDSSQAFARRILAIVGIPVVLTGATVLVLAWNAVNHQLAQSQALAGKGAILITPAAWALLNTQPPPTPFALPTAMPTATAQVINCPLPSGWVPYTVNPTDSLYRLSVIYGVSVDQLLQVNCLGDQTTILPGQVIYMPNNPTQIPLSTATNAPVRVLPSHPPQPVDNNSQPASDSPAASERPTQAPPTNTSLPPTDSPKDLAAKQPTNPPPAIFQAKQKQSNQTIKPAEKPKIKQSNNHNKSKNGKSSGKGNGKDKGKGKGKGKG